MISCSTLSLACNTFRQSCDPSLYCTTVGISFLYYLFHMKIDHNDFDVLDFHHNFANSDFDISNSDRNPNPPSSVGRHKFSHFIQCLLLPSSLELQKNLAKILCKCLITLSGGSNTKRMCLGKL